MSDSIPTPTPWLVDPALVRDMRRGQAEAAFQEGKFDRSLVEADELLQADPEDPTGLWVFARSALAMGDACAAQVALEQLLDLASSALPVPVGHIQTELAFAYFLQGEFDAARAAASAALTLDRSLAAAWVCVGLVEERLGRVESMTEAFERAESIRPGSAPKRIPPPPPETWERLWLTAMQHLSEDEAQLIAGLDITWGDWPAPTVLKSVRPPISPFIELLITGDESSNTDPLDSLDAALQQLVPSPTQITVFTANLSRGQPSTAEIVDRIVRATRSELAAWLGVPAEELTPEPE